VGFWTWILLVIGVFVLFDIDLGELFSGLWFIFLDLCSLAFWVLVIMALFNLATM
jgi:hypothetical protein